MSRVTVLLATWNGARHLPAQLASFVAQDHEDWALWVSDDGSTDDTNAVLAAFRAAHPTRDIRLIQGPGQGAAANFLSLIRHPDLPSGPVALSDQDDVWMPHRLSRGLAALDGVSGAGLSCGTSIKTDAELQPLHGAPAALPAPRFHHALVQNTVAGNTITLNPAALALLRSDPSLPDVPFHDWWLYLRLSAAGAQILCDTDPCVYYRQHGQNLLGDHWSLRDTWGRLGLMANGTYRSWLQRNLTALLDLPAGVLPAHRQDAEVLLSTRPRLQALRRSGAARSDRAGRVLLPVLALAGRV